jgi:O-antigen/teichoic acid export membrane protein
LLVALAFLWLALKKFKGDGTIRVPEISAIAWPLFLIAITNMVMTQGDIVLVGNLLDEKALAFYGVALRLTRIVVLEMLVLGTVISPLIAKLYAQQEKERLEKVMRLVATLAMVPLSLVMLILVLFGDTIIAWIFGEVYREAYPILIVLVSGLYFTGLMGSGHQLMVMTGYGRELLPITVFGGLFAILTGILTAPFLGATGIALGFSLATSGIAAFTTLRAKKLTGITSWVHSPFYFLNGPNRREVTQELGRLLRQSMGRKNSKGRSAADED